MRRSTSTRLALAILACWCVPGAVSADAADTLRVTVLHTTDLHGALTAYDYTADRDAPRGLVRIASLVREVRAEGRPTLLLDAGDAIGGAIETVAHASGRSEPDPMMAAMSHVGYDAMAPGNHEFDFGLEDLERARREARFPWLAANVVREADGSPAFGATLVRELGGVRIGIVGLCTPAVPSLMEGSLVRGLRFLPPVDVAAREVARLRSEERCDAVILVAHTGLERDPATGAERRDDTPGENWGYRLATEVPGVDVVILGHTHALLPWARFGGALVVQAGSHGRHLGRVDLTFTRPGGGTPWQVRARGDAIAVTDSVADDPALQGLARPWHAAVQRELSRSVVRLEAPIASPDGHLADSAPWDLIHRAQLSAGHADVSLSPLFDPSLRLPRGEITRRDLLRLYPYDNTLLVLDLSGAELKQVLEAAAGRFPTYTFEEDQPIEAPGGSGINFDAAEGVSYEIDLTRAPGDRVVGLSFEGRPLDPARRLRVAVNSYRANGGGGYPVLASAPRLWRSTGTVRDLIESWLRSESTARIATQTNWRLLPDYVLEPERPAIDRLVRRGVAPPEQVLRLGPRQPAMRGDLAYWLARSFDWRARRASNAFSDVPDSLAPWLDGLLERRILGPAAANDAMHPFHALTTTLALDWCERAAQHSGYALRSAADRRSFRRSLLTGVAGSDGDGGGVSRAGVMTIIANTRFPTIRVLQTSDFHGAILPGARERRTDRPLGGSAVLAAWIEKLRAENPEGTVLIDGGDCFQGTMISNLQFGRPVVEQMNALRYDAFAVGNHEFDWSADTLVARVRQMRFAALAANMQERRGGRLPRWVRADTAFARRGVDVGVFGLSYRNTPSVTLARHVAHLRFEDDSAAAARAAPRLRRAGADLVLGVGHVPAESDSLRHARGGDLVRLARGVRGVDAWFGGHSHNLVLDEVDGVPLMIPGSHGQYVAVCDLVFDPVAGRIVERRTRLQPTYADEVAADSAMAARVERWNADVAPLSAVELGRNARTLTRNRNRESSLGDLVADAMREAAGADLALQNSGGLRADLREGVITKGAIYEVMPFDNTLVTMELTGAEIRRAFEEGLRFGRIAQLSGMRIAFDPGRPEMERVVTLTMADGSPLEDAKTYRVVVNNFMATGGDNYDSLAQGRNVVDTGLLVRGVLEDYVGARTKRGESLDVALDGRIERLGNTPPTRDDR